MIRAINKKILEVGQNDDTCFEKALLFLKSDYLTDDYSIIKSAESLIKQHNNKLKAIKYRKQLFFSISRFIFGYLLGILTFIIATLLF